jgi:NADPH-dependent glutamate synthase beta subunit-like oxidoreductase
MDYLKTQNKLCSGEEVDESTIITAKNKVVVVIGGGDTGSDCIGTARRQGAKEIHQLEILPEPPETRPPDTPWPMWPRIMRTSTSHEEGCQRQWSVMTKKFSGIETRVTQLQCCQVEWVRKNGTWKLKELPGTDFTLDVDVVLLAMGFLHVSHNGLVKEFDLKLDESGNVLVDDYQTSQPAVFAAGDTVSGASLVVRAIDSGRQAAAAIDNWLKKQG